MNWKFILVLILFILAVIFTIQNYEVVEITFLFWSFNMSRAIIIFSSILVGLVIGMVISLKKKR